MTNFPHPSTTLPDPGGGGGGHDIYNFGRPLFGHHYYIFSLSDLCL